MNVLVIEDDDIKFELLVGFFADFMLGALIDRAASYQSGVTKLVQQDFDFVLLDMSLPVSDLSLSPVGMEWLTFGGQYILRECARRKVSAKIVIVSQYKTFVRNNEEVSFEQLKDEILQQHEERVIGCVFLDRTADNWKQEIFNLIGK